MSKIESRLRERDEARKAAVAARRLEKEKDSRTEETHEYFTEKFSLQKTAIEDLLEAAKSLSTSELPEHFNTISGDVHSLHRLVSDATLYLASFELKIAQEQVGQLQAQITASQDQLLAKKKFAFKSRPKKETVAKPKSNPPPSTTASALSAHLAVATQNQTGFRGREKELLTLSDSEMQSRDLNLSDIKECEVKLFGSPVTLHMSNMDNCCVLCGPVSSSVFVDNCRNCTFVVACQQLRVHTTVDCVFYLHVTSRAIIEDSRQLQFAPYCLSYPKLQAQFQESGLSEAVNNWDNVDDFNWLVPSTPSPNWTILPQEQRKTWTDN